jgi:hypothetical protein
MRNGAEIIVETDDDNLPKPFFWEERARNCWTQVVQYKGWVNVYALFTNQKIWPRGLPLDNVDLSSDIKLTGFEIDSPIQQGLADGNPDVDAIYRLLFKLPFSFYPTKREIVALDKGAWCPFNSQNTVWFKDAFPLMYLPSSCSFRMTDIWRSFIAQRIAWENDWRISYYAPTVIQERNDHYLMKDFEQEVPGYLNNRMICEFLNNLNLKKGKENIPANLFKCYEFLIEWGWIKSDELYILEDWLKDVQYK